MEFDFALLLSAAYLGVFVVIIGRIILRPQREPASRLAWLIATIAVPVVLLGQSRMLVGELIAPFISLNTTPL